jgi:hypothetical protein
MTPNFGVRALSGGGLISSLLPADVSLQPQNTRES